LLAKKLEFRLFEHAIFFIKEGYGVLAVGVSRPETDDTFCSEPFFVNDLFKKRFGVIK
jgi:hypothetical protein